MEASDTDSKKKKFLICHGFPDLFPGYGPRGVMLQARRWGEWTVEHPVAALFIVHGLAEHAGRYDSFAEELNKKNLLVFSFGKAVIQVGGCSNSFLFTLFFSQQITGATDGALACVSLPNRWTNSLPMLLATLTWSVLNFQLTCLCMSWATGVLHHLCLSSIVQLIRTHFSSLLFSSLLYSLLFSSLLYSLFSILFSSLSPLLFFSILFYSLSLSLCSFLFVLFRFFSILFSILSSHPLTPSPTQF